MEKEYFGIIGIFIVLTVLMFFIISQVKVGLSKNIESTQKKLDEVKAPLYTPLGISIVFTKIALIIISSITYMT